jgi:hypothetical protein
MECWVDWKGFSELVSYVASAVTGELYQQVFSCSSARRLLCKSSNSAGENTPSAKSFISAHDQQSFTYMEPLLFPSRTLVATECPCFLSSLISRLNVFLHRHRFLTFRSLTPNNLHPHRHLSCRRCLPLRLHRRPALAVKRNRLIGIVCVFVPFLNGTPGTLFAIRANRRGGPTGQLESASFYSVF